MQVPRSQSRAFESDVLSNTGLTIRIQSVGSCITAAVAIAFLSMKHVETAQVGFVLTFSMHIVGFPSLKQDYDPTVQLVTLYRPIMHSGSFEIGARSRSILQVSRGCENVTLSHPSPCRLPSDALAP